VAALGTAGLRGPLDRKGVEVWGQAFGRIADQRRRSYNEGYGADGYGFAAGTDTAFDGGRSLLGAAVAYTETDADGDGVNRTASDVDSTQVMLYGDHLFENRVYAKGMLGYGWHANDIARHNVGGPAGPTVRANYDAWSFAARAEAGRAYAYGDGLTLSPRAVASYVHYEPDEYTESGPLGLTVAAETKESFRLGLGVVARWDVALDADALLQPELRLDYRHDLAGDRFETISEFTGAPGGAFVTEGVRPGRDILNLGIGALLATAAGVDVRASYDLELKEDYAAHGGYVRASVAF
jgi:outer membrane autotransporter protein